ncbi:MAG: ADP-glyceromanno-heptose 6-epimerase [Flavobacteriales bacterium]
MIVVTGAAGFIGSCLVSKLIAEGYKDVVVVDDFTHPEKAANLTGKTLTAKVNRTDFFSWLDNNHRMVQFVYHIGARTDTAEFNVELLNELNLRYTQQVWKKCVEYGLPLVYASSAATYGLGEHGYNDDHSIVTKLKPLNPYGISKNDFDIWALEQPQKPYFWCGIKFFNVYGPNEYHKGRMASVILHAFNQIKEKGSVKLFRSHKPEFKDGEQLRDFIYVKDAVDVLFYFLNHRDKSGIYNLGTGKARTFYDLASNVFTAQHKKPEISFIDTPKDIRDKYQYFTEANMQKLKNTGYALPFTSLEDGIKDYVTNYLLPNHYY